MDHERWERITSLFIAALDRRGDERAALLDAACAGDPALRHEIEALLANDRDAGKFLEQLPADAALNALDGSPPEAGPAGRRIGAYTLRSVLGRGGTSIVYEAEQTSPHRIVALKVLRALPLLDDVALRLFRREVRALARLDHPGIAAIHEAGCTDDGWHYFAMEKVDGEPITVFAQRRALPLRDRLELFARVCEAVQYAHQRGVIHRDLKPSNILVSSAPDAQGAARPKVLDFGLARCADLDGSQTAVTQTGLLQGTLAYMSPEQAGGPGAEPDVRTDVYSLGVVLHELLTDRLPYRTADLPLPEAVRTIRETVPPPAGSVRRELRGDPETILAKAMAKDPDQRYASAAGLAEDVERFLSGQPIVAHPPSAMYQLRKLVSRHRVAVSLLAVLLLVIVVSTVATAMLAVRFADQRDQARTAQDRAATEAEAAAQFASFLDSILENSDPEFDATREPSLRQVLDDGYQRIDGIANRLVRARVMTTMGRVYGRLDQPERAGQLLESALAIRRADLGPAHPDTLETLGTLARIQTTLGHHDAAYASATDVLAARQSSAGGPDDPLLADAFKLRGEGRFYAEDYARAADDFAAALAIRRRIAHGADPELASSLSNEGFALTELGHTDEAEPLLWEAVDIRTRIGDSVDTVMAIEALGQLVWQRDRAESERIYAAELAMARRVYRPEHPRLGWVLTNYAFTVDMNHGAELAEPLYRESVGIYRGAFGENPTRDVAWSLEMLARNLLRQSRTGEARALLCEAVAIRTAIAGPDDPVTRSAAQQLAALGPENG